MAPPVEPSVEPSEVPTEKTEKSTDPLTKIEVEWQTGGPYGERPRLTGGIKAIFIDSPAGEKARAVEHISLGKDPEFLIWQTRNGGQSWEKGEVKRFSQFVPEEQKTIKRNDVSDWNAPEWEGWEKLLQQFPVLDTNPAKKLVVATDANNPDLLLVAVTQVSNESSGSPMGFSSWLFFSLDKGETYREVTLPASTWSQPYGKHDPTIVQHLIVGSLAFVDLNDHLSVYLGLGQWEHDSFVYQTTIPLASQD